MSSIAIKREGINKGCVGTLLNGMGNLVTGDAYEAEEINVSFASVPIDKVSQAFVLREGVQGGEHTPVAEGDQVRDLLRNLNPPESMGQNRTYPGCSESRLMAMSDHSLPSLKDERDQRKCPTTVESLLSQPVSEERTKDNPELQAGQTHFGPLDE